MKTALFLYFLSLFHDSNKINHRCNKNQRTNMKKNLVLYPNIECDIKSCSGRFSHPLYRASLSS